jgi:uncharacterized RmlC-like cupin family protein
MGTVPPGAVAPLHSHPDPETFIAVGEMEGLAVQGSEFAWTRIRPGDVFHVPADAWHAFRNRGAAPAVAFIVTTSRLGRFFEELANAVSGPPSAETVTRFLEIADRYGHWNATPEENAAVGIDLPAIA